MNMLVDGMTVTSWTGGAGLAGIGLYVLAYAMLQLGFLRADTYTFCALNAVAGVAILFGLTGQFEVWTAMIQLLWVGLSLIGAARIWIERRAIGFDADEAAYLKRALPKLPKRQARSLMDLAHVMSIDAGTELTTQGEEITHLAYLLEGDAEVMVNDQPVAALSPGAYIGEVTYTDAQPATATVILSSPALIISFEADTLRAFLKENPGVQPHLEASAANNLRAKLIAANERIIENEMARAMAEPDLEPEIEPEPDPDPTPDPPPGPGTPPKAETKPAPTKGSDPFFGDRPPKIKEVV